MPSHPRIQAVNTSRSWWSFLVYADPGAGKTFLAGTSARADHDTLIVRPPTDHTDTLKIHFPNVIIDEFVVRDWEDADEIHEYLRHEDHGYRWVWAFDSISLAQDIFMDGLMDDLVARKDHRNLYVPDRPEYLENMNRLKRYLRLMSALDFNLGMTAHVKQYTFETTLDEKFMPDIQGKKMPEKVSALANVVGHLSTVEDDDGETRLLRTHSNEDVYAKDGYGAFPAVIKNPTITAMEKAVERAKKNAAEKSSKQKKSKAKTEQVDDDWDEEAWED